MEEALYYGSYSKFADLIKTASWPTIILLRIYGRLTIYVQCICDRDCENRACGHKLHPHHYTGHISVMEQYYLHSVTYIIRPIKCLLSTEYCIATA